MTREIENLKATLALYLTAKKSLEQDVKLIVQDTDFPLEERWNLFVKSGFGEHDYCYLHLNSYNLDDFYSYCERYETYSTISLIDWIYEDIASKLNDETPEEIDSILNPIKEEILSLFIRTFLVI
jgi:hypothetical protein